MISRLLNRLRIDDDGPAGAVGGEPDPSRIHDYDRPVERDSDANVRSNRHDTTKHEDVKPKVNTSRLRGARGGSRHGQNNQMTVNREPRPNTRISNLLNRLNLDEDDSTGALGGEPDTSRLREASGGLNNQRAVNREPKPNTRISQSLNRLNLDEDDSTGALGGEPDTSRLRGASGGLNNQRAVNREPKPNTRISQSLNRLRLDENDSTRADGDEPDTSRLRGARGGRRHGKNSQSAVNREPKSNTRISQSLNRLKLDEDDSTGAVGGEPDTSRLRGARGGRRHGQNNQRAVNREPRPNTRISQSLNRLKLDEDDSTGADGGEPDTSRLRGARGGRRHGLNNQRAVNREPRPNTGISQSLNRLKFDEDDSTGADGGEPDTSRLRGARGGRRHGQNNQRALYREPKTNTRRVEILTYSKLRAYENTDSSKILLEIGHDQSGLSELLNLERPTEGMVHLTLSVLAKACKCYSAPQSLSNISTKLLDSRFLTVIIPEVLLDLSSDQIDENESQKTILNICAIIETLLMTIPLSCIHVSGIINTQMSEAVDNLRSSSKIIGDDVLGVLTELQELWKSKYETVKMKRQKIHSRAADDNIEGEPPDDFRDIPIIPTMEDLHNNRPFLRKNKVNSAYENLDDYLDVQFRLLREDFIHPLRNGINEYLTVNHKKGHKFQDIRLYTDVTIVRSVCSRTDLLHRLSLDLSKLKRVNWQISKRLIYGSLVCLSADNFQTFYLATVSDRDPKLLKHGYIDVRFEHDLEEIDAISTDQQFVMVETTAYFEAYKHVLKGLQKVQALPFAQYIVEMETEVNMPRYLRNDSLFDLRPLMNKDMLTPSDLHQGIQTASSVNILDPLSWPAEELLNLDQSQYAALKTALAKEFSVIQGPPGTGKTYLGLKVVKALLHNRHKWNNGPILIVCYTNHALDQFLEGISTFFDGKIVRVGGRISSPNIEKYSLKKWKDSARIEKRFRDLARLNYFHSDELKTLQKKIETTGQVIEAPKDGILNENALRHVMKPEHDDQLEMETYMEYMSMYGFIPSGISSLMVEWLGIGASGEIMEEITSDKDEPIDVADSDEEDGVEIDEENQVAVNSRILDVDDVDVHEQGFNEIMLKSKEVKEATVALDISKLNIMQSNDGFVRQESKKKLKQRLRQYLESNDMMTQEEADNVDDIWQLDNKSRWRLYRYWISENCKKLKSQITDQCKKYRFLCEAIKEVNFQKEQRIMADASVIAMTTTGAARYQKILEEINPKIIIVEEAAEVLEAHVITSITRGCEQLILIGDHKQLRPNPNVFTLAVQYNLQISLFERMLKNGVHCDCLEIQHRMRPEISKLMKPIYPSLQDHHSVTQFEQIKGISKNIFFINHGHFEQPQDENKSHSNLYEAEYVFHLTEYLLKQGYPKSEITILTTYSGQLFAFKKLMPKSRFEGIRITAVDNFQGEENEIIILSLVRCNEHKNIGFLKTENRICVALSRAKKGLFVIGNFDILASQSPIWKEMTIILKQSNEFGNTLNLRCQNHPEDVGIEINKPKDFSLAPAGGCQKSCMARLDCGHSCAMMCHPLDQDHKDYRCIKPCTKLCKRGHPCQLKCYKDCSDCQVLVEKIIPTCGHVDMVKCYKPPDQHKCTQPCTAILPCGHKCGNLCGFGHRCKTLIQKTWPCKHTSYVPCSTASSSKCIEPCGKMLECEHPCEGDCSACFKGKLHQSCTDQCTKSLVCDHGCTSNCSDCLLCKRPCNNRCAHSKCKKTCGEVCVKCTEPCAWRCEHLACTKLCYQPCDRTACDVPCQTKLRCGHECIGLCGEPCPKLCRICDNEQVTEIFFGTEDEEDARFVQLPDCGHSIEHEGLDRWMEENTSESATNEIQLKACPKCKTTIRSCVRYGPLIKRLENNIDEVKKKLIGDQANKEKLRRENRQLIMNNIRTLRGDNDVKVFMNINGAATTEKELACIGNQLKFLEKCQDLSSKLDEVMASMVSVQSNSSEHTSDQLHDFKQWIIRRRKIFSQQEINDASTELHRLTLIINLYLIEHAVDKKGLAIPANIKDKMKDIKRQFTEGLPLSERCENDLKKVFEDLEKIAPKSGLGITEEERVQIIEAMDFGEGHWFKCPNGHIYAIGDCGGATVEAKCPECEATIGGERHALRSDNRHAGEMDGSQRPAWSDVTNLANYGFDARF